MSICYQLLTKGGFISYKSIPSHSFSNIPENFRSIFSVFLFWKSSYHFAWRTILQWLWSIRDTIDLWINWWQKALQHQHLINNIQLAKCKCSAVSVNGQKPKTLKNFVTIILFSFCCCCLTLNTVRNMYNS